MRLFKLEEGVCADGCPYYQRPPTDFDKEQQYHRCELNYNENLDLSKIKEACPITNIETLLEDFMQYIRRYNYNFDDLMNFQLSSRIIFKFIEEEVL